jgi:hypothetical protein
LRILLIKFNGKNGKIIVLKVKSKINYVDVLIDKKDFID